MDQATHCLSCFSGGLFISATFLSLPPTPSSSFPSPFSPPSSIWITVGWILAQPLASLRALGK